MDTENTRSFFAVQLGLRASPADVDRAIQMIRRAFSADGAATAATNVTTAPAPAAQVTPAEVAEAELDSDGLPWDARIHAGTKSKTKAGVWTKLKGVEDSVRDAVLAELRQQYPAATAATSTPTTPAAPTVATPPAAPTVNIAPPVAAAPLTPYQELTDWLAKNTGAGHEPLTDEWVKQTFADNGTSLAALATDQDASKLWLTTFQDVVKQMGR